MSTRTLTVLMPALRPSDCVRHWPVALLLAACGGRLTQSRVDARLARARCVAQGFAPVGGRYFVGARD